MKAHTLEATMRTITGHQAKNLLKEGVLPAVIYGKTTDSLSIQLPIDEFVQVLKQTGETGLINLTVDGTVHPVLIKNVGRNPVSGTPNHVEFHQVNLKEKIHANVPIVISGESQAVKEKIGTLLQLLNEIEVEALPTDLPEHIEVDISNLVQVDDRIMVHQLSMPNGVTLLTDPEIMVVKIGELLAPEPEPTPEAVIEETATEGEESKEAEDGNGDKKEEPTESPKKE